MLSYLKDGSQSSVIEEQNENMQQPGQTEPQTYLTVSGQGKKVKQGTMVLGILFAVGALALWLMAQKTSPASADAAPSQDQAQLDAALAQLDSMQNEINTKMNSVAGRFSQFSSVEQVSVDELKKNPFMLETNYTIDHDNQVSLTQQQELARQEAQVMTMSMELWSITTTPKGICCMIDDKVLYVGDTYKHMTVKSIEGDMVTLDYKGVPIQLKMD